jgi:hypothetical protein
VTPEEFVLLALYHLSNISSALWYLSAGVGGAVPAAILAHAFLTRKR